MSASREKQNRQNKVDSGWVDPKLTLEAEQKAKDKKNSILYSVIAVVFVLVVVLGIVWKTNTIQKNSTAATINGEKYTAAEVNFYYQNAYSGFMNTYYYVLSLIGLDTTLPLQSQTLNETAAAMLETTAGITWHNYFLNTALEEMAGIQNGLEKAKAEGFVYPEEVQLQHESAMTSLKSMASSNGLSEDAYLTNMFGSLMPADVYEKELLKTLQYEAYITNHAESLTYTLDEMEETYKLSPNDYDSVSYEYLVVDGAAPSTTDENGNTVTPTDEEKAAAMAAAKKTAEELLEKYEDGTAMALLSNEAEGIRYVRKGSAPYSGDTVTAWLFDESRKADDCEVVEGSSTYYVLRLIDRFREDYNTINVRHVLIQPAAGTLSATDAGYDAEQETLRADAKAKAEELYAQWQSGEATEDSFAQMAMTNSSDSSSINGGLYSKVYKGQMVAEFEDWCFAEDRKTGDTGIVETPYGYHIMYFSGEDLPYWQSKVTEVLSNEDALDFIDSLSANSVIEHHNFGMKFVG